MFQKVVPMQDGTNPICLYALFLCRSFPPGLNVRFLRFPHDRSNWSFFFLPSPAPYFRFFQEFVIYFPKYPTCSTIQSRVPNISVRIHGINSEQTAVCIDTCCSSVYESEWKFCIDKLQWRCCPAIRALVTFSYGRTHSLIGDNFRFRRDCVDFFLLYSHKRLKLKNESR
jgi:hypothetical protein